MKVYVVCMYSVTVIVCDASHCTPGAYVRPVAMSSVDELDSDG